MVLQGMVIKGMVLQGMVCKAYLVRHGTVRRNPAMLTEHCSVQLHGIVLYGTVYGDVCVV